MASDLTEDLVELRQLLGDAKRPRVQALLSNEISNLEKVSSYVIDVLQIGGREVFLVMFAC